MKPYFKAVALLNALLLMGLYIAYQAGVFLLSKPAQVGREAPKNTLQSADTAPPTVSSAGSREATGTSDSHIELRSDPDFQKYIDEHEEMLGGSKSAPLRIRRDSPADVGQSVKRKILLNGSKSLSGGPGTFGLYSDEAPAPTLSESNPGTLPVAEATFEPRLPKLLPRIVWAFADFLSAAQLKRLATESAKREASPTLVPADTAPVRKRQEILGGSKSPVLFNGDRE